VKPKQLMRLYLDECRLHVGILTEALTEARQWQPFTPDSVEHMLKEQIRVLDQVAYRFAKLQDSMGQKILPAILELGQEPITPNATFAEKLNWLERMGALPSAEEWKKLRVARNAIAHEYPDDPELRASAINSFMDCAMRLGMIHEFVTAYLQKHFPEICKGTSDDV